MALCTLTATGDDTSLVPGPGMVGLGATAMRSAAVTVGGLTAGQNGRLTFTLVARGGDPTRFNLPMASAESSRIRFTLRSHPTLPITVQPGASVRVTVDVKAACRSHTGVLPRTYGLLLPQAHGVRRGPASRTPSVGEIPVEGWDDGTAAAALTAAALKGCS